MTSQQDMTTPILALRSILRTASLGAPLSSSQAESLATKNNAQKTSCLSVPNDLGVPDWTYLAMSDGESRSLRRRKRRDTGKGDQIEEATPGVQIARDSREPAEKESAGPAHGRAPQGSLPDLIAFVAVLATGVALVIFGHVQSGGLTTACVALGGLYAVWLRFRRSPRK
jgi:hypothetical protein